MKKRSKMKKRSRMKKRSKVKKSVSLSVAHTGRKLLVLHAGELVCDVGATDVDFEGGHADFAVGMVEKVLEDVKVPSHITVLVLLFSFVFVPVSVWFSHSDCVSFWLSVPICFFLILYPLSPSLPASLPHSFLPSFLPPSYLPSLSPEGRRR